MRQLSSLDTQFLNVESTTTSGHVGSVVVVDPASSDGWGLDAVRDLVEARLHLAPVLRQRLVEVPLGLARPYWADDPAFDLDFHVREVALPTPGSERQLGDLVARLHARPLDRTRPPWEMYVVTGLAGGRAAVYTKIHHAAVDGVSGAALLGAMLDIRPEPRSVEPPSEPFARPRSPHRSACSGAVSRRCWPTGCSWRAPSRRRCSTSAPPGAGSRRPARRSTRRSPPSGASPSGRCPSPTSRAFGNSTAAPSTTS